MLKVGIVDDHRLFRKSLALLIGTFDDTEVHIDACNGREFLDKLEDTPIDLVLLDIEMPEMDGFATCAYLREHYPEIKVLIVSQLTTRESIHKIMELGADGYFTKNSDPAQLEQAITSLHQNGFYFGMELGNVLREAILWEKKKLVKPADLPAALTPREIEIITMAARELSSTEIAAALNINVRTVDGHRNRLIEKTGAKNFIGVVLYALRHQFFLLEDLV
jgi:two-component system response regulator DegU